MEEHGRKRVEGSGKSKGNKMTEEIKKGKVTGMKKGKETKKKKGQGR